MCAAGPVVHVAVNRPDVPLGAIKRAKFRSPLSPKNYNQAKVQVVQTKRRFKYAFLMTYMRDSNYQMFVVSWYVATTHSFILRFERSMIRTRRM